MRLLRWSDAGQVIVTQDFVGDDMIPPYAILSHTWGKDIEEVTFEDLKNGAAEAKAGYEKIRFCGEQAKEDGLEYFWVDTCCINKANFTELSTAIVSMFRWYRNATRCYVYLSDVPTPEFDTNEELIRPSCETSFRNSRWFKRGWTLQELLAPSSVEFFSRERKRLGDKETLKQQIREITGIADPALQGAPLSQFSVTERFSWIRGRKTKIEEDEAYSMLGIFEVSMPLIYGEGRYNAFRRLRHEINKLVDDHMEPASKRRKIDLHNPDVGHSPSPPAKKDLLESLRFDQIDDRFVNIKTGHSKTCRWLLKSTAYLDWLNPDKLPEHHGFFWIKGKPGCGKSTLTKFAFMEIKKSLRDATLLSFFFNARGTHLERSTVGLYRSLLVQLLATFPDDQLRSIPSLTHQHLDEKAKANPEILKQLLVQLVQRLDQHDITVIIDALDECDEDEVRDMIALFEELGEDAVSNGRTFRVLFSSRYYPHVTIQQSVQIRLEDQHGHFQDIEKYLSNALRAGKGKHVEQIRDEIRDRASGVFLWVVLVVKILNKAIDHGHVHALRKKLQEIPDDLNELFRRILTRDRQNMDEMKLCIQWILYSNLPLKPEELYFAMLSGLEPDEPLRPWDPDEISTEDMNLFILSSSKGLAEITKTKAGTVQFIHESVRDFLLKENGLGQIWADLEVNASGLSHNRLKECCFNYTRSESSSRMEVPEVLPPAPTSEALELRKKALLKFPFLKYAIYNLLVHADISQAKGIEQEGFIKGLEIRNWVQLNNVIETYQVRRLPADIDLLYILAERNCPDLIDLVMRNPPSQRSQNGRYGNPIFAAIAKDNRRAFEALTKVDRQIQNHDCEFPYPSKELSSFLMKHGQPELVYRFTSLYRVDVTSTLKSGETILTWASARGHVQLVKLLLDKGADVNAQGGFNSNALHAASSGGHEQIVKLLLDKGAVVYTQGGFNSSALYAASSGGHEQIVKLLLDKGAVVYTQGGFNSNALHAASSGGHEQIVKLLLDKGADVNAQGGFHVNALYAALSGGHEQIVKLLLDKGAVVYTQGGFNSNALHAASFGGHEQIVKLLLDKDANVNAQDKQ